MVVIDLGKKVEAAKYDTSGEKEVIAKLFKSVGTEFRKGWKIMDSDLPKNLCKKCKYTNGLLSMLHAAFSDHVCVILKPDDLWFEILKGISIHEKATKSLGSFFKLDEQKKKELIVYTNTKKWDGVFPLFVDLMKKSVGKKEHFQLLNPIFSTSTAVDINVRSIALMNTFEHYFSYTNMYMCYIPKIEVAGKKEDWELLLKNVVKIGKIKEFKAISNWFTCLEFILQKFVDVFDTKKKVDVPFFRSLYQWDESSGSESINGWVLFLYPYLWKKGKYYPNDFVKSQTKWLLGSCVSEGHWFGVQCGKCPNSFCSAPALFKNSVTEKNYSCRVYSGCFGFEYSKKTRTVSTANGWFVVNEGQKSGK